MNKTLHIIGVAALLCTATACEDWLDMPSESKADSSTIFSTVSRAEMAVMGGYASLHTQEEGYQLLMGTDEATSTESNSKYAVSNYDYTNTSSMLSRTYNSMYQAIEYANVCIKSLPDMKVTDGERRKVDALLGEALAIRAYAYWNLVRFYGDVPYTSVPTADLTSFSSSRVSRDTIYDHCVADLQRAVELLPWRSEGMVDTPERFTKNAAYGMLARVALYAAGYSLRWDLNTVPYDAATCRVAQRADDKRIQELYRIAADACQAVINKGENHLLKDYDKVFRDLGNQAYNEETLLEYGWYGPNSTDVRTGYVNGIPTSGTDKEALGKGGAQMVAMPTLYFEFTEGDQRRDVSVSNYGLQLSAGNNAYQMLTFAGMGVGKYRINWKSTRGASDTRRDINWPLLRYSDVLLMYAEALNEIHHGATPEAVNAVKEVRMRAFRNDAAKVGTIPTGYAAFKDFLIEERKLELSNEGLRRTDLARWGILVDYLTAEKEKLVLLAKRAGRYAGVAPYRAYKLTSKPAFNDATVALSYVELTEQEVEEFLTPDELKTLHVLNSGTSGFLTKTFYEDAAGKVYFVKPAQGEVTPVTYTLLNMFGIHTIKQKGNLCVEEVKGVSDNNPWITGSTGVFYGLKKNMTELMPFNTTGIIDVNPGLAQQQHPCY